MSTTPRPVHVFLSGDRRTFGLTYDADGANLPWVAGGWGSYDEIPVCMRYLARYAKEPEVARANLSTQGYYLAGAIGRIMPRPSVKPCSMWLAA